MRRVAPLLLLFAAACSPGADESLALLGTGRLSVTVSGLPPGAAAEVTVTGPDGMTATLDGSADLADLVPGTYVVSARPVIAGGETLQPHPSSRQVAVEASAEPSAADVAYGAADGFDLVIDAMNVTQVVQSLSDSIPLVAGRDALIRVFVRATEGNTAAPVVRLRLYHGDSPLPVRTWQVPAPRAGVPTRIAEDSLETSWNQLVPGALLVPGARLLADVDAGNAFAERDEADNAFPHSGIPRALDVRSVAPMALRLVAVRTARNGLTGNVSAANRERFLETFGKLFPLATLAADVRAAPYVTTTRDTLQPDDGNGAWITVLSELNALRAAEGFAGTYYGVVKVGYVGGVGGMGYVPGRAAIGWDRLPSGDDVAAHELGHTLSLDHAPCGGPRVTDARFPSPDGRTGIFGVDVDAMTLRPPSDHDIMGYCRSDWISAYHYLKVLRHRAGRASLVLAGAPEPGLLVWGRISDGRVELEPAFEVTAPPALPAGSGAFALELLDEAGAVRWRATFEGDRVDHGSGELRHFAFVVPRRVLGGAAAGVRVRSPAGAVERRVRAATPGATLRADAGGAVRTTRAGATVSVSWDDSAYPMALVRDAVSGAILSFARGGAVELEGAPPAIDVLLSDGVRNRAVRIEPH